MLTMVHDSACIYRSPPSPFPPVFSYWGTPQNPPSPLPDFGGTPSGFTFSTGTKIMAAHVASTATQLLHRHELNSRCKCATCGGSLDGDVMCHESGCSSRSIKVQAEVGWWFPEIGAPHGTSKSSILMGFFPYKPTICGYPHLWKPLETL